jgi:hypothetical protein
VVSLEWRTPSLRLVGGIVTDLVLPGSVKPSIKFKITNINVLCFGHLVDSHVGTPFFAGHIYAVVSPRGNE